MRKFFSVLTSVLALGLALPAPAAFAASHAGAPMAAAGTCEAKAAEKKLAGAAKTSFVKKCEADSPSPCDAQAADKKLAGAAKTSFLKKCQGDTAAKACEATAGEKKLAGAAKNSFMKKCEADAVAAKK